MKTKTILSVFCLLSAYCLLSTAYCFSAVPSLINYQGVLKDSSGVPYDGNATMVFSIWGDSTDGNKLWEETQAIVSVSHGLFNVLLGSSHTIPDSVFAQPNSWLQVIANGSQLSPRRRIVSVGYALHSEFTDTAEYAFSAPPDDDWDTDTAGFNIYRMTGNIGIGTPSPQGKLDINGPLAVAGDVGTDGQFLKTQGPGINPVWSDVTAVPADNSVSQAKLKTATGEVSVTGTDANLELPGGTYGFYPQLKASDTGGNNNAARISQLENTTLSGWTSYKTTITLRVDGGRTLYAQQRYVTSSGKDHWIFLLGDRATTQTVAGYQAPDHPCYGSGGDENDIPHPFGSYDPDKHEVILIDNEILPELKAKVTSKRSLLTVINEDYEIDFDSEPVYQPREIIEIDEYGDKEGEILLKIKTPEWAKILIGKDEIYLKRRLVETLPSYISYTKLKSKSEAISESQILSQKWESTMPKGLVDKKASSRSPAFGGAGKP